MGTNIISVNTYEHRESVAKTLSKYDFMAIPVVDNENRLVGIVTFDDVMDVIEEETTEDMEKMAGMVYNDEEYFKTSVFQHFKNRILWLLFLMLASTFTGLIISHYQVEFSSLDILPMLMAFIPTLMDTGGNCGSQSVTLIIRGMSVDEIHLKDYFKVLFKEFRVALLCSGILAVVNFIRMYLIYKNLFVAVITSVVLVLTIILAKVVGCSLPMLSKRLHIDPTMASSPLITTIVDTCSLLVYFVVLSKFLVAFPN
jgi:magnesium transporter